MQAVGFIGLLTVAIVIATGLSVSLYAALPKAVLLYAERHGRFQGLTEQATLRRGTRAGLPPGGLPHRRLARRFLFGVVSTP